MPVLRFLRSATCAIGTLALSATSASASDVASAAAQYGGIVVGTETLAEALASAYANNPDLNAQRAGLRATDEAVPQARSAFLPSVDGSASANFLSGTGSASLGISQTLFDGFGRVNALKSAETSVLAGRETLRSTEQNTLLAAVRAFMGLVQAQAVLNLRSQNVDFLREQVRAAEDRLSVGEGTRTDVAQTNARLAAGQSQLNAATASQNSAIATYQQVIGHVPSALGNADSVETKLPTSLDAALAMAMAGHPSILAARYAVDNAAFGVKSAESNLLPTASISGGVSIDNTGATDTSLSGRVSMPIFTGGANSSRVRQAKETLGQRQIQLDSAIASTRQATISAWGSLDSARAQIVAANAQVTAQQLVLSGVTEERRVGQATTLDVLNAQQELLNARVAQVQAQHDRVVAAYSLLAAIGMLNADILGLNVDRYDPTAHYDQVRNAIGGLRTPDGR